MKKAWKYILTTLLVIILATAGTLYYFLKVKTYDVADKEIEEITKSEYQIELPKDNAMETTSNNAGQTDSTNQEDNTSTNQDEDETTSATNTAGAKQTNSNKTNSNKTNTTDTSSSQESEPEVTVASIKDEYRSVFGSLESQANEKINALVSRAIDEYQQKKSSGENISFSYFYQKYSSAGQQLESKTDEAFTYIYKALQEDLKDNGFSPTHAKDFKEQYENAKSARESALLNKAKEAL